MVNKKINFGKVKNLYFFGGGPLMRYLVSTWGKEASIMVITGRRHLEERESRISLADFLKQNKIEFCEVFDINTVDLSIFKKDLLALSFGAPWIFKKNIIDFFGGRLINSHDSDLPKNRGGGGYSWRILNNDRASACLLHQIDAGIDTGLIIKMERFNFPLSCRIPADYERFAFKKSKSFFDSFMKEIFVQKTFSIIRQNENISTYFPRLYSPIQGAINWSWSRDEIIRFINAFDDPYCGASTFLGREKVFLKKCRPAVDGEHFHAFVAGVIYRISQGKIFVATRSGGIEIAELINLKKLSMMNSVKPGQRLFTPAEILDEAVKFYSVYESNGIKLAKENKKLINKQTKTENKAGE